MLSTLIDGRLLCEDRLLSSSTLGLPEGFLDILRDGLFSGSSRREPRFSGWVWISLAFEMDDDENHFDTLFPADQIELIDFLKTPLLFCFTDKVQTYFETK